MENAERLSEHLEHCLEQLENMLLEADGRRKKAKLTSSVRARREFTSFRRRWCRSSSESVSSRRGPAAIMARGYSIDYGEWKITGTADNHGPRTLKKTYAAQRPFRRDDDGISKEGTG